MEFKHRSSTTSVNLTAWPYRFFLYAPLGFQGMVAIELRAAFEICNVFWPFYMSELIHPHPETFYWIRLNYTRVLRKLEDKGGKQMLSEVNPSKANPKSVVQPTTKPRESKARESRKSFDFKDQEFTEMVFFEDVAQKAYQYKE